MWDNRELNITRVKRSWFLSLRLLVRRYLKLSLSVSVSRMALRALFLFRPHFSLSLRSFLLLHRTSRPNPRVCVRAGTLGCAYASALPRGCGIYRPFDTSSLFFFPAGAYIRGLECLSQLYQHILPRVELYTYLEFFPYILELVQVAFLIEDFPSYILGKNSIRTSSLVMLTKSSIFITYCFIVITVIKRECLSFFLVIIHTFWNSFCIYTWIYKSFSHQIRNNVCQR